MKRKDVKLYNLIFPIWLLWLVPITWLVIMPANFLIDFLVTFCAMKYLKIPQTWQKAKSVIFKVWILGFAADFIGTVLMFLSNLIDFNYETAFGKWWYQNITNAVAYYPFESIYSILWVTASVVLSACFIYLFNYKISFKKLEMPKTEKKKVALALAVFTAPYLFFLPTSWFF